MKLTEKAKQLIPKARIFGFDRWSDRQHFSTAIVDCIRNADDDGRYLTDEDLAVIQAQAPHLSKEIGVVKQLRDRAAEIVSDARKQVIKQFPNIDQPGGDLHPPERAEACWRDFWHFLRCITYGIAIANPEFTREEGLHYMNLLYQELRVPLPAMVLGVETLKIESLRALENGNAEEIAPYFDHLIAQLTAFQGYQ
jgi:hypothetical protein